MNFFDRLSDALNKPEILQTAQDKSVIFLFVFGTLAIIFGIGAGLAQIDSLVQKRKRRGK
ncbi:MAG: hypothetical protein EBR82_53405 [Caulobacteraceae bacterium]|nr:hypothetical protein [Caulobacteraceae bacterium]